MRKLIVEEWLSLDGYAADSNGQLDFFPDPANNKFSDADQLAFLETIDTILLGRKTYELFVDFWPTASTDKEVIADKLNSIPKLVFSNTLQQAPWGNWPPAEILAGDAVDAVRSLKEKQGKNLVLWGSILLVQALMNAGLGDEYHLQVCPTATGGGRLLFPVSERYFSFKLVDVKKYDTGVVLLTYQPST